MRSLAASPFKAQSQQNHFNRVDTGRHSDYQLTSNSVAGHFSFVQYAAIALINKADLLVIALDLAPPDDHNLLSVDNHFSKYVKSQLDHHNYMESA